MQEEQLLQLWPGLPLPLTDCSIHFLSAHAAVSRMPLLCIFMMAMEAALS